MTPHSGSTPEWAFDYVKFKSDNHVLDVVL